MIAAYVASFFSKKEMKSVIELELDAHGFNDDAAQSNENDDAPKHSIDYDPLNEFFDTAKSKTKKANLGKKEQITAAAAPVKRKPKPHN